MTTADPTLDAPPPPPTIGEVLGARAKSPTNRPGPTESSGGSRPARGHDPRAARASSGVPAPALAGRLRRRRVGRSSPREEWRTDVDPPEIGVLGLVTGTFIVAVIAVLDRHPARASAPRSSSPSTRRPHADAAHERRRPAGRHAEPALRLWGFQVLQDQIIPLSEWLARHFSWFPSFRVSDDPQFANSMFIAGIVVSLMVLPIIAADQP